MSVAAIKDIPTVLSLQLEDGDGSKYPQATLYDAGGVPVSTEDLSHVAQGHYTGIYTFTILGDYFAVFVVYDDVAHATESVEFFRSADRIHVTDLDQNKSDLTTYSVKQAWTRNPPNMLGTVWLEKNGQRIPLLLGDALSITAKIGATTVFTGSSATPNADGRYNLAVAYMPTPGTLIDIDAEITNAEGTFKSQVSLSVPKLSA